jgi:hypothetical protein
MKLTVVEATIHVSNPLHRALTSDPILNEQRQVVTLAKLAPQGMIGSYGMDEGSARSRSNPSNGGDEHQSSF